MSLFGDGGLDPSTENDSSGAAESSMEVLPTELLIGVLSLLPTEALCYGGAVRNVCRRWRQVSSCTSVWRRREARCSSRPLDRDLLLRAVRVAPEMDRLAFHPGVAVPEGVLQGCSRVRALSVQWNGVCPSEAVLLALLRHYSPQAESLHLAVDAAPSREVLSGMLRSLAASRSLRTLRLGGCLRASDADLDALAGGCPNLRELDVKDLVHGGPRLVARMVAARGQRLTRLVLPGRDAVVPDVTIEQIASSCCNLVSLGAGDADAIAIIGHLPCLRQLSLWHTYAAPGREALAHLATLRRPDAAVSRPPAESTPPPRVHDARTGVHAAQRLGGVGPALARLEELSIEVADDTELVVRVLGACGALRRLALSGDYLDRQLGEVLEAAPPSVSQLELWSFTLAHRVQGSLAAVVRNLPNLDAVMINNSVRVRTHVT